MEEIKMEKDLKMEIDVPPSMSSTSAPSLSHKKVTLQDVVDELDANEDDAAEHCDDERDERDVDKEPNKTFREHKYKNKVEPVFVSEPEFKPELDPKTKLKQCVDRVLLCYCRMQDHTVQFPDDFSASEIEAVTDMAMDLLVRVLPGLTGRTDSQTRIKTMNYLKFYYELYKAKQIESRRQSFLDEFTDVIRLGEMEDFFLETSLELAKPIQQISRQLDAQVNEQTKRRRSRFIK